MRHGFVNKIFKSGFLLGFFILIANLANVALGQTKGKPFKDFLSWSNLVFTAPPGYTLYDDTLSCCFVFKRNRNTSAFMAVLQNDHDDIIISITLIPFDDVSSNAYKTSLLVHPETDINRTFKQYIVSKADTAKSKVIYYDKKYLSKIHASRGAEYVLAMDKGRLYHGKYTDCKVVVLQRDNKGAAFLYYFYNDKTKSKIDAVIAQTFGILKFKG